MAGDFMNLVFPASPQTGTIAPPQSPQVNGTLPRYYHQLQGVPYEEIYRQRVSQACDLCRRRKAKRCTERDLSCEYADAQSVTGQNKKTCRRQRSIRNIVGRPRFLCAPCTGPFGQCIYEATSQGSVVRTKPARRSQHPFCRTRLHVVDSSTQDRGQDYADYWPFAQYPRTASDTALDYSGPSTGISYLYLPGSFDDLAPSNMLALFDHALSVVTSDKNCNYASTQPNGYHNSSGEPEDSVLASSSAPIDPQIPCSNTQDIFYTIVAPLPSLPFPALGLSIDSPSVFCPSHDLAHSATTTGSSSSTGSPFSVLGMLPPDVAEVSLAEGVNIGDSDQSICFVISSLARGKDALSRSRKLSRSGDRFRHSGSEVRFGKFLGCVASFAASELEQRWYTLDVSANSVLDREILRERDETGEELHGRGAPGMKTGPKTGTIG
ncbi:zinc cluster transcription factor [Salix suchowensis]|nr:zinc cluster transcription factor [Salix suchowensis]